MARHLYSPVKLHECFWHSAGKINIINNTNTNYLGAV